VLFGEVLVLFGAFWCFLVLFGEVLVLFGEVFYIYYLQLL